LRTLSKNFGMLRSYTLRRQGPSFLHTPIPTHDSRSQILCALSPLEQIAYILGMNHCSPWSLWSWSLLFATSQITVDADVLLLNQITNPSHHELFVFLWTRTRTRFSMLVGFHLFCSFPLIFCYTSVCYTMLAVCSCGSRILKGEAGLGDLRPNPQLG